MIIPFRRLIDHDLRRSHVGIRLGCFVAPGNFLFQSLSSTRTWSLRSTLQTTGRINKRCVPWGFVSPPMCYGASGPTNSIVGSQTEGQKEPSASNFYSFMQYVINISLPSSHSCTVSCVETSGIPSIAGHMQSTLRDCMTLGSGTERTAMQHMQWA